MQTYPVIQSYFRMRTYIHLILAACAFCTLALGGELTIRERGNVVEVSAYELADDAHLSSLLSGGRVVLPVPRISVIRAAEIALPVARPSFPMRFRMGQVVPETPFGELIHAAARRHDLNPELIRAIVRCESGYDPDAISPRGARGLLQLMPATAARFGLGQDELADPERNLDAGARYLSWLTRRFHEDLDNVLAAFNSGEGTVDRYDGVPPYRETRAYLSRVYSELGLGGRETQPVTAAR